MKKFKVFLLEPGVASFDEGGEVYYKYLSETEAEKLAIKFYGIDVTVGHDGEVAGKIVGTHKEGTTWYAYIEVDDKGSSLLENDYEMSSGYTFTAGEPGTYNGVKYDTECLNCIPYELSIVPVGRYDNQTIRKVQNRRTSMFKKEKKLSANDRLSVDGKTYTVGDLVKAINQGQEDLEKEARNMLGKLFAGNEEKVEKAIEALGGLMEAAPAPQDPPAPAPQDPPAPAPAPQDPPAPAPQDPAKKSADNGEDKQVEIPGVGKVSLEDLVAAYTTSKAPAVSKNEPTPAGPVKNRLPAVEILTAQNAVPTVPAKPDMAPSPFTNAPDNFIKAN